MFYLLSKTIGLIINPLLWILTLLAISLLSKRKIVKHRFLLSAIILTLIFSNSFILNEVFYRWELPEKNKTELKQKYNYGIVLSGMIGYDTKSNRMNFLGSSDRIWQAVKLYREGKIDTILITGGAASLFNTDTIESILLKKFLVSIGIPEDHIISEELARNTHENALFTARYLAHKKYDNLLLITSASHMRRSIRCFEKVGLQCDIFPTDHYSGTRKYNFEQLLIPNAKTLLNWNVYLHEILGMLSYKIAGYI